MTKKKKRNLLISLAWDALDFVVPPGLDSLYDLAGLGVAFKLFGVEGVAALLDVVEFTGTADKFIPSMTIAHFLNESDLLKGFVKGG